MLTPRGFASDNASGVHPRVLEAIAAANNGHAQPYGDDVWSERAACALQGAFDAHCEPLFCFGGTGANVIALATLGDPHDAVVCADTAHLWTSEGAAPERFLGSKILPVHSHHGKLTSALLEDFLQPGRGVHQPRPSILSVTQPTELGTVYSPQELRELCLLAHEREMRVHIDGARLANAAAALDTSLAAVSRECGADAVSFGGTKNGLMGGEVVLVFESSLFDKARRIRKQSMQLASKMRFLAAQFIAYLDAELWRQTASTANRMAARLYEGVSRETGVAFEYPVETNMLFPRLPLEVITELQQQYSFYTWDASRSVARWVTSFDTEDEEVDGLVAATTMALRTAGKGSPRT